MGNKESFSKDDYYMHIQLIGSNMEKFYEEIKKVTNPEKKIKNYWEFDYNEKSKEIIREINSYFKKLSGRIEQYEDDLDNNVKNIKIEMREVLIFKIDNCVKDENAQLKDKNANIILSPEVDLIFDRLNKLYYTHFMPIVLLLTQDRKKMRLNFSPDKYKYVDPRLILITYYDDDEIFIDRVIDKLLLRFCSIHNELGDRFSIKDPSFPCDYELIDEYFPFNLNIACIGRFGQGKSTGVNKILQEYKARESSKGSSQTKRLNYYHVSNQPVKILDIPGFNDEKTINDAVNQFKFCGEEINRIKDNLHIILYFLNYHEVRKFERSEAPIFEEIKKHKSSKIIYVITHCNPNMDKFEKRDFIRTMKEGLNEIINDEENILIPTMNNVVFLNFFLDLKTNFQPFGEKELYKKIHDFFIMSDVYQNSNKRKKNKEEIEKEALELRAKAKATLLSNKVFGAAIGAIPGVDWLVQKFLIKKDAVKKVGKIFGIDIKFIHESSQEKEKNFVNDNKGDMDIKALKTEVNGDKIVEGNIGVKIENSVKIVGETGIYINGGQKIVNGIKLFNEMTDLSQICTANADKCISIAQKATEQANSITFLEKIFTNNLELTQNLANKASSYAEKFSSLASSANKVQEGAKAATLTGMKWTIIGAIIGIGLGGYFTHKFCEDLLDEFENYYKSNADKISNSYENAAKYFENQYSA